QVRRISAPPGGRDRAREARRAPPDPTELSVRSRARPLARGRSAPSAGAARHARPGAADPWRHARSGRRARRVRRSAHADAARVTSSAARDHLLARLERAGASIAPSAVDALEQYFALLARWNPRINLTALPLTPPSDDTFDRLFVEPVAAARHIDPAASGAGPIRWIDLGSGGGSPAI